MKNYDKTSNNRIITEQEISDLYSEDLFLKEYNRFYSSFEREPLGSILPSESNQYNYYDIKFLEESQTNYESNNLLLSLKHDYDEKLVIETMKKYKVGTSKSWKGTPIYWYIDIQGRVCSGQIKNDNCLNKKSMGFDKILLSDSILSELYKKEIIDKDFNQKLVFFGEHLLADNKKPIAIVESEKTAIIASMQYPNYTWIATGKISKLNYDRTRILIGKNVTLCPKNDTFNSWYNVAAQYGFKLSLLVKNDFFEMNGSYLSNAGNELSECIMNLFQVEEYFKNYPDDFN